MTFDDKIILAIEYNILQRYIYDKFSDEDIKGYSELFDDYKILPDEMIETIDFYVEEIYEIESDDLRIQSLLRVYQKSISSLKEIKRLMNNMLYDSDFRQCNFYKVLNRENVINNLLD